MIVNLCDDCHEHSGIFVTFWRNKIE